MSILIWQIAIAVATMVMLFLNWQSCRRHYEGRERRVVPVRRDRYTPVQYVSRVGEHSRRRVVATRTVALSTLPMPIRGTIEPAEREPADVAPSLLLPDDLRFAPPDAALMRRVIAGLKALPDGPRDT
jgi:hypothetical protein